MCGLPESVFLNYMVSFTFSCRYSYDSQKEFSDKDKGKIRRK